MKRPLSVAALFLCALTMNSCSTSSISKAKRKADIQNSKETNSACFVKFNDGTIKQYTSLKLVTSAFTTPYLLADGKTKIKARQIVAYQNKEHYAVSQKTFCCGRMTSVATETLPGFAVRTVKGKINVYCKKFYNGQVAVDEYFIQAGDNGKIVAYSPALMNELVKDNSEAAMFFNDKKFKGSSSDKLQTAAHMYNSGQLVTKN